MKSVSNVGSGELLIYFSLNKNMERTSCFDVTALVSKQDELQLGFTPGSLSQALLLAV